jgi:hypothetical protein
MSVNLNDELQRFNRFVSERIGTGNGDLSPEEALDLWRSENPSEEERTETILAVEEAIEELRAGDPGVSLETFDADFRRQHGLGRS